MPSDEFFRLGLQKVALGSGWRWRCGGGGGGEAVVGLVGAGGRWTNVLRGRMREVSLLPSSMRLDFLLSAGGGFSFCSSESDWRSAPSALFSWWFLFFFYLFF